METKQLLQAEAISLVNKHLEIWGETDRIKREFMIKSVYTDQVLAYDPGVVLTGQQAISEFIDGLQGQHPDFRFTKAKPVEAHHQTAILSWQFGPLNKPDTITGEDVFFFENGLISTIYIFVHGVTS
jgi:hypothetical protein